MPRTDHPRRDNDAQVRGDLSVDEAVHSDVAEMHDPLSPTRIGFRQALAALAFGTTEEETTGSEAKSEIRINLDDEEILSNCGRRAADILGLGLPPEKADSLSDFAHLRTQLAGTANAPQLDRLKNVVAELRRLDGRAGSVLDEAIREAERLFLAHADAHLVCLRKQKVERADKANLTRRINRLLRQSWTGSPSTCPTAKTFERRGALPPIDQGDPSLAEDLHQHQVLDPWAVAREFDLPVVTHGGLLQVASPIGTKDLEESPHLYSTLAKIAAIIRPALPKYEAEHENEALHLTVRFIGSYMPPGWFATPERPDAILDIALCEDQIRRFLRKPLSTRTCNKCSPEEQCPRCSRLQGQARRLHHLLREAFPSKAPRESATSGRVYRTPPKSNSPG